MRPLQCRNSAYSIKCIQQESNTLPVIFYYKLQKKQYHANIANYWSNLCEGGYVFCYQRTSCQNYGSDLHKNFATDTDISLDNKVHTTKFWKSTAFGSWRAKNWKTPTSPTKQMSKQQAAIACSGLEQSLADNITVHPQWVNHTQPYAVQHCKIGHFPQPGLGREVCTLWTHWSFTTFSAPFTHCGKLLKLKID